MGWLVGEGVVSAFVGILVGCLVGEGVVVGAFVGV